LVVGLLVGLGVGCHRSDASVAPKSLADRFDIAVGGKVVHLQLAVAMPEMERGLMERRDLGPDDGMLFVYERPQRMSFWMRNTPTPLDIGFFDSSGMLEEIYPMQPFDETGVQSRSTLLCLALEMNQGWFRDRGLKPGAQIDVAAVRAALKARGFEPTKYAIGR
jgi:uncharacterized membrane protein (UPF0127 family)